MEQNLTLPLNGECEDAVDDRIYDITALSKEYPEAYRALVIKELSTTEEELETFIVGLVF